jgi:hypothetical protein
VKNCVQSFRFLFGLSGFQAARIFCRIPAPYAKENSVANLSIIGAGAVFFSKSHSQRAAVARRNDEENKTK